MPKNCKILICGAGVAGPCLAYWLQQFGFEPAIIERSSSLRTGGYIVDFWGLGFEVAEKMGLVTGLRQVGYQIDRVRIVNSRGRTTGGFSVEAFKDVLGDRYLSVLRSDLSRAIFDRLGTNVRTIFDNTISALRQTDDYVEVTYERGGSERFDLVVGAGGLHSPVRNLVFGPSEWFEHYLGYQVASFSTSGYGRNDPRAYITYSAPGLQVSRYSLRGGRTVFLLTFVAVRKLHLSDSQAQKLHLARVFGHAGWECKEMLGELDRCQDLYFDSVSQIHMNTWHKGRVALVGDASSCASLLAGQGSSLAMAGAYILAGELARAAGNHRVAFIAYERLLQPLMARKQRAAEKFARSFVPETRIGMVFRNQVTKLMSHPTIVRLAMGHLLRDGVTLPNYS
jgi:2-polyprenyl-6-methoxyphenol hydroxylase-like FAD-dependent oxidoreductase